MNRDEYITHLETMLATGKTFRWVKGEGEMNQQQRDEPCVYRPEPRGAFGIAGGWCATHNVGWNWCVEETRRKEETVNQQQRDKLRAKHSEQIEWFGKRKVCYLCLSDSVERENADYPCDTIQVLDALEAEKSLFYMACGYISAQPEWSSKHPEDVVKFFRGAEATTDQLSQPERTNGSVSPAQTDTIVTDTIVTDTIPDDTAEYPPEGENVECDHVEGGEIAGYERNEWLRFAYCPKCGEEL